jgi:hypothetical protein
MNPRKFVDWAVDLLQKGFETENILILASMDNYPTEEIEGYFWKCVNDLNLKLKKSDFELFDDFAIYIANSVLKKEIKPKEGLKIMNYIVISSDYSIKYIPFLNLDEDLISLKNGYGTIFNSFGETDNIEEIIIEEFKLFLKAENLNLADKYQGFAYCQDCNTLNEPKIKQKKNWLGKVKYVYLVCSLCKSKNLEYATTQKGKRLILSEFEKNKVLGGI